MPESHLFLAAGLLGQFGLPSFLNGDFLSGPFSALYLAFWIWMLVHCVRHDPERQTWLWLLVFLPGIGPVVYFFVRFLPGSRGNVPQLEFLKRFTSGRQLARLEHAARTIGNAHQWLELADLQREIGKPADALQSYLRALGKDPNYLPALWGAAQSQIQQGQFAAARPHLEAILKKDFTYKFGDVSLAYGRVLYEMREMEPARQHVTAHLQRWRHPEGQVLMAQLLRDAGDSDGAREHLETLLGDLAVAPAFFARQQRRWAREARTMLRSLP